MQVLILSDGKLEEKEIDNTLDELQKIVGGYIEFPFISKIFKDNIIDIIINEEGKYIDGLKPEIAIIDGKSKQILDVVMGNCIFASHDQEGNTTELNDQQIKIIKNELQMEITLTYQDTNKEFIVKALFV